jgi:hypothetical protein
MQQSFVRAIFTFIASASAVLAVGLGFVVAIALFPRATQTESIAAVDYESVGQMYVEVDSD